MFWQGWGVTFAHLMIVPGNRETVVAEGEAWWAKVAGILITWFAVLLGAPFWFDLLKKFVPVRQTGTKPHPSAGSPPAAGDAQSRDTDPA